MPDIANKTLGLKWFVLGGGSNIILPEQYLGLVIHNKLMGIEIVQDTSEFIILKVGAGENWDNFVEYTLNNGWYGLENLSLIPGTVGASPIQNIGAYGVEVKDLIESVEVYDTASLEFKTIDKEQCSFTYRNSIFKTQPNYIVTSVYFRLKKIAKLNAKYGDLSIELSSIVNPGALDLRAAVIKIRQSKLPDPKFIANVGSFFHNPIVNKQIANSLKEKYPELPVYPVDDNNSKLSAGWLIDNLGLKGYRFENMGVYSKQALVLINHGSATKSEVLQFAGTIIDKVYNKYQIKINIEPIIIT